ncbi:MAG: type II toxin-antitoxin system RelE/ParE family toxin [Salibacteraceae bacterium]
METIFHFIANNSPGNASKLINEILSVVERIRFVDQFQIDEYRKDLRRIVIKNHKIYYYSKQSIVFIVAVVATRRNP